MGERRKEAFRVGFDRSVKIEFRGTRATSDAGLQVFRELDETLGLTGTADDVLTETRKGQNTRHGLDAQLRQPIYSRLALPQKIGHWSLRSLQTQLIKIGAKVVRHARYTCFQMAEVTITPDLIAAILRRIRRLMQPVPV